MKWYREVRPSPTTWQAWWTVTSSGAGGAISAIQCPVRRFAKESTTSELITWWLERRRDRRVWVVGGERLGPGTADSLEKPTFLRPPFGPTWARAASCLEPGSERLKNGQLGPPFAKPLVDGH